MLIINLNCFCFKVFPRFLPEALSTVTLWKRFSDVKTLYKELVRRHRERHLSGTVPQLTEKTYFKRFDPRVIEERKRYILELLEFAGAEPVLYQSYAFVKFFERGISPEGSPLKGGNIAAICEDLAIPVPKEFELIDPRRCGEDGSGDGESEEGRDDVSSSAGESVLTGNGSMGGSMFSQEEIGVTNGDDGDEVDEVDASMDYIVEAAMVFSRAVQAEANGCYKEAFDRYKAGIDKLLSGAKGEQKTASENRVKDYKFFFPHFRRYESHEEEDCQREDLQVRVPSRRDLRAVPPVSGGRPGASVESNFLG